MARRPLRPSEDISEAAAKVIDDVVKAFDLQPGPEQRARIRRQLEEAIERNRSIEIEYEFNFLGVFTIRHKARIGASVTRARLVVLFIPAIMLTLALAGTIVLIWLLGPQRGT